MRKPVLLAAAGFAALAVSLTACGSSGNGGGGSSSGGSSSMGSMSMGSSSAMSSSASGAGADTFGSGCAAVPTDSANPGSFDAMSKVPVATAASGNPVLSTLVSAVKAAGLVDTLNNAQNITVFAPSNDAFKKIPAATLSKVLADKATLTKILTYHVVPKRLSPTELTGALATLEKGSVNVSGSQPNITVNDAKVICGNVQTANATVYIIDTVLMPKS